MLILVCAKYYVLETKNIGDMTKFSELPEQPSYIAKRKLKLRSFAVEGYRYLIHEQTILHFCLQSYIQT